MTTGISIVPAAASRCGCPRAKARSPSPAPSAKKSSSRKPKKYRSTKPSRAVFNLSVLSTFLCHCEERSDVAIRNPNTLSLRGRVGRETRPLRSIFVIARANSPWQSASPLGEVAPQATEGSTGNLPIKSLGLRFSSVLSTAAHTMPGLHLPPAAPRLVAPVFALVHQDRE